jgi:hypothetical protein
LTRIPTSVDKACMTTAGIFGGLKRWVNRRTVFSNFLMPLAVLLIGHVSGRGCESYENRIQTLNYSFVSFPATIRKPELGGRDFKITIDGKPVENVSTVSIYLFNTTGRDYEDVPISITFRGPDQSKPVLIRDRPDLKPEQYERRQLDAAAPNELRLGYDLRVVNRSDKQVFQCDFTFEGATVPEVSVDISKKGVEAQHVDFAELRRADDPSRGIVIGWNWPTVIFLSIYGLLILIGSSLSNRLAGASSRVGGATELRPLVIRRGDDSYVVNDYEKADLDALVASGHARKLKSPKNHQDSA